MSTVKQFTVGTMLVNAAMPSALEQDEALSLIGAGVIQRAIGAAREGESLGTDIIRTMFVCMPTQVKQRVANILLSKTVVNGTGTPVTIADFQGQMMQYNTLLAELTLWNYSDFFISLNTAAASAVVPGQPETAQ